MDKTEKIEIYEIDYNGAMDFIKKLIQKTKDDKVILKNISYYLGGSYVYFEKLDNSDRDEMIIYLYEKKYKSLEMKKGEVYRRIVHEVKNLLSARNIDSKVTERIVRHVLEAKRCI